MTPDEIQAQKNLIGFYSFKDYGPLKEYELELASSTNLPAQGMGRKKLYIQSSTDGLEYQVLKEDGTAIKQKIPWSALPPPPEFPQNAGELLKLRKNHKQHYYHCLQKLLTITKAQGHTYEEHHDKVRQEISAKLEGIDYENTLYKGIDANKPTSTEKRRAFIELLARQDADPSLINSDKKKHISMEKLLGKDGLKLFEEAMEEEANDPRYRNAVFLESVKHYEGPRWLKRLFALVTGSTGSGKSTASDEGVKKIAKSGGVQPDLGDKTNNGKGKGNDVVYIDGGIERDVSQIRSLVVELSIRKGFPLIDDLDKHKHNIKDYVEAAANAKKMNILIPITAANPLDRRHYIKQIEKLKDTYIGIINVKTPRQTNIYQGEQRAAYQFSGLPMSFDGNNRHLDAEMKKFKRENIKWGLSGAVNFIKHLFFEDSTLLNKNIGYFSAENDRTLYKTITNEDGSSDWQEWIPKEAVYLLRLPEGGTIDKLVFERAEKENTPIIIDKGKGEFIIYGFSHNIWQETPLNLHDEETLPENLKDRLKATMTRMKQRSELNAIFKKYNIPEDGQPHLTGTIETDVNGESFIVPEKISRKLLDIIQPCHTPEIEILSKQDFQEWQKYKANQFRDELQRLPSNLSSPQEWLDAYQKLVPRKPVIETSLKDTIIAPPRSPPRDAGEITLYASFDKDNINEARNDKNTFFETLSVTPEPELIKWAETLLKYSGDDPDQFILEFNKKIAGLAFTDGGSIQPWLLQAIGKAFIPHDHIQSSKKRIDALMLLNVSNGWFEGDEILREVLRNNSPHEIMHKLSSTLYQLLRKSLNTVSEKDEGLKQKWLSIENTLNDSKNSCENLFKYIQDLEKLSREPLPSSAIQRELSALLGKSKELLAQRLANPTDTPLDVSAQNQKIKTFLDRVAFERTQPKIKTEDISPKSSHRNQSAASTALAGVSSGGTPSLAEAQVQTWSIALNQGEDNEVTAIIEDRALTRKGKATSSVITQLSVNLDIAQLWAKGAVKFKCFPNTIEAHAFFTNAIKQLRENGGIISSESLGNLLDKKFEGKMSPEDLSNLKQDLYKTYLNRAEQLDGKGQRFPSDAFIALARITFLDHLKNCTKLGIEPPVINISKDCWAPQFVQAMMDFQAYCVTQGRNYPKPTYEGGWEIKPINEERVKDFAVLYQEKGFDKLDRELVRKEAEAGVEPVAPVTVSPSRPAAT